VPARISFSKVSVSAASAEKRAKLARRNGSDSDCDSPMISPTW
jgi:hypothetical protein